MESTSCDELLMLIYSTNLMILVHAYDVSSSVL